MRFVLLTVAFIDCCTANIYENQHSWGIQKYLSKGKDFCITSFRVISNKELDVFGNLSTKKVWKIQ